MDLIQPYFKLDCLMPRVFVYLCPYEDIFRHIQKYYEMVSLICWKIGYIFLPNIIIDQEDKVQKDKYNNFMI